ncbi:MAG: hypothetical protein QF466_04885 [Desulfobacterales bacterium]|nr:hypothetical protein [Desulfobacterales bacterium]MDP6681534.1 hypothetical protein [Desulfobacterales bacterium]MDP6806846.1 hypothetical protein [Desulfobacterales bacterium]
MATVVNSDPLSNHRAQERDGLDCLVISVAAGMITLKKFCAVVKALVTYFFQINFFLSYARCGFPQQIKSNTQINSPAFL